MPRTPRHCAAGLFQRLGGSSLGSLPLEYKRPAGERISPKRFGKSRPTNPIQGVLVMRSKLLLGVAAPALAALTLAATSAPASAQWRGGWGWGGAAVAAGVIGGVALAAAATSPYYATATATATATGIRLTPTATHPGIMVRDTGTDMAMPRRPMATDMGRAGEVPMPEPMPHLSSIVV
jgi:hypothetical protein